MTRTTQLPEESELTTTKFEDVVVDATKPAPGTNKVMCQWPDPPEETVPDDYISTDDLVGTFDSDPETAAALRRSRTWIADTFYAAQGETVRTLRLRKGWSQAQLADALGTKQPNVARIERGTGNLYIDTCRKLCTALDIDMNRLDEALRRQELATSTKTAQK